jgi:hypothetical protein
LLLISSLGVLTGNKTTLNSTGVGEMKKILIYSIMFLMVLNSIVGLTASIGNARMVLYPEIEAGKTTTLNKTIYVNNMNNESVKINIYTEGNFSNYIEVLDESFILDINESKEARFLVSVNEPGRIDGKILVQFNSLGNVTSSFQNLTGEYNRTDRSGFGLASNVIIIAREKVIDVNETNETTDLKNESKQDLGNENNKFPLFLIIIIVIVLSIMGYFIVGGRGGKK